MVQLKDYEVMHELENPTR